MRVSVRLFLASNVIVFAVASLVFFIYFLETTESVSYGASQGLHQAGDPFIPKSHYRRPNLADPSRLDTAGRQSPSLRNDSITDMEVVKRLSTVDYMACCGLGHRMSKVVDAHHIAWKQRLGLRIFFGFCDKKTEIFHYFFGPQPVGELQGVHDQGNAFKINNEAPCFRKFGRMGNTTDCECPKDYMIQSGIFFQSLVNRFTFLDEVQDFQKKNDFSRHLVLGLHVRAGNGEQGDFQKKNRTIGDRSAWVQSIAQLLRDIADQQGTPSSFPPLVFVATDTASIVDEFRMELKGIMRVVDYPQDRALEGTGVAFGEQGAKAKPEGEVCLTQWKNSLLDMILLSSADVVVASRPSSFTQSLPMSVVLSRSNHKTKNSNAYCEVHPSATSYQCFDSFEDWCCNGRTDFHLHEIRKYEYLRMPSKDFLQCDWKNYIVQRPEVEGKRLPTKANQRAKGTFLPYDWATIR